MGKRAFSALRTLSVAGAYVSYYFGAGFATGQEVMQFFTAYGSKFAVVGATVLALMAYCHLSLARAGRVIGAGAGRHIFRYYAGKRLGAFFDSFSCVYLYATLLVMYSGAAHITQAQYRLAPWIGAVGMALLVYVTFNLGLRRFVKVLGFLGPAQLGLILLTVFYTLYRDGSAARAGAELIASGAVRLRRIGVGPVSSGFLEVGQWFFFAAAFTAELANLNTKKDMYAGSVLGAAAIVFVMAAMCLALISNIAALSSVQVPMLALARKISPRYAVLYTVAAYNGTYATSIPLLWAVTARFSREGTAKSRLLAFVLSAVVVAVSLCLPLGDLVNIIYSCGGYAGVTMLIFQAVKDARTILSEKRAVRPAARKR